RATGRRVEHLGFAVAAAVILTAATVRYGWHWLDAFRPLAHNAARETRFALPHRLTQVGGPHGLAVWGLVGLFAVVYAWLLWQAARGRARLGLTMALALLATPYLAAWYAVWAAPLAAAEDDRAAQALTLVLSAYLLRQTVPI